MDQQQLQSHAADLRQVLARHASGDMAVASLHSALGALLAPVLAAPLAWGEIPGSRLFTEGSLRRLPDLEQAYARFRIEATGGESPALSKLRGDAA